MREALTALGSNSWQLREAGLNALLAMGGAPNDPPAAISRLVEEHPGEKGAIHKAIINSLERANTVQRQYQREGKRFPNEDFGNYTATLIWIAGALHDPKSVPALLGQINSGQGATQALASLGEASLPGVLRLANAAETSRGSNVWLTRCSALATLAEMLQPQDRSNLSARSINDIRSALIRASRDSDRATRVNGVRGLGTLGDPTLIPLLDGIRRKHPDSQKEIDAAIATIRHAGS